MTKRFQHQTLVTQVAKHLEEKILNAGYGQRLPSERDLCARLQVSRMTLRAALNALRHNGLIKSVPRRGNTIARRIAGVKNPDIPKVAGIIIGNNLRPLPSQVQLIIRGIEHHLESVGYELICHSMTCLHGHGVVRRLKQLTAQTRVGCWILLSAPLETQRWFFKNQFPVLVLGSCYPDIQLPEFDVDYRAVSRHAVGMLMRLGHRRITLVSLKRGLAGDVLGETGFREAFKQVPPAARPFICHHDGSLGNFRQVLNECFGRREAPTALLVAGSCYALAALGHLTQKGFRVPHDVSLVCRDGDDFLEWSIPPIAQYVMDVELYARRCARALVRLAETGSLAARLAPVMPRFVPAGTVMPAP